MTQDEINAVKKAAEKMRKQESAQDEIIELARQSGWTDDLLEVSFVTPMLERFAKLVAAKEREACAKVCDELPAPDFYTDACAGMWDITTLRCGDAIRARGEA
jgi:hypothetical protein